MLKKPIILDCDPGVDDAFAIMLANSHEGFDIRAVTVVSGNVEIGHTSGNAIRICSMLNMDARVGIGAARPLIIEPRFAGHMHGDNGLGGLVLPEASIGFDGMKAWDIMYDEAVKCDGELEIIAVGPLTNVAIAILKYRNLKELIRRITIMGGSVTAGNHSQYGEFNTWADPHAAEIVFQSGIPVTMFGLNATTQCALPFDDLRRLGEEDSIVRDLILGIYDYVKSTRRGSGSRITLHDAIAVGYLIDDSIAKTRSAYVSSETVGIHTHGMTIVDFEVRNGKTPNSNVAVVAHPEVFRRLLEEMIEFYRIIK